MKIGFFTNFGFRGTDIATFDYAFYNQLLLGNQSLIFTYESGLSKGYPEVIEKFRAHFEILIIKNEADTDVALRKEKVESVYFLIHGNKAPQGLTLPMYLHCVYHLYPMSSTTISAGISESVGVPFVPHIVNLPVVTGDYRSILKIPEAATVFGRYGAADTFDFLDVALATLDVATINKNIYFIFCVAPMVYENIHINGTDFPHTEVFKQFRFLETPLISASDKGKFINTCDAMIHAQCMGETFGLAIAEFSCYNKPIILWDHGETQEHLRILGDRCLKYHSTGDLKDILLHFPERREEYLKKDWRAYAKFSPESIIKQFDSVFIRRDFTIPPPIIPQRKLLIFFLNRDQYGNDCFLSHDIAEVKTNLIETRRNLKAKYDIATITASFAIESTKSLLGNEVLAKMLKRPVDFFECSRCQTVKCLSGRIVQKVARELEKIITTLTERGEDSSFFRFEFFLFLRYDEYLTEPKEIWPWADIIKF